MSNAQTEPSLFRGYTSPTYTPVPDILFDEQLPLLSGAELKVLLYLMRRTFGFKKDADTVSLKQICRGIVTREGRVLDAGTGLSRSTVQEALKGLIRKRIVFATKRVSRTNGNEPTSFRLNCGEPPGTDNRQGGGPEIDQGRDRQSAPQEPVRQQTARQRSNNRGVSPGKHQTGGAATHDGRLRSRTTDRTPLRRPTEPVRIAHFVNTAHLRRPGSSPPGGVVARAARHNRTNRAAEWEVIEAYLADFSRELNDQAPLRASVARAVNLMNRAGLSHETFLPRLFEARALTKDQADAIRTTVTPDGARRPVTAKMAYFFAVLEDLLGLRPEQPT